jgi:hypothetical protein
MLQEYSNVRRSILNPCGPSSAFPQSFCNAIEIEGVEQYCQYLDAEEIYLSKKADENLIIAIDGAAKNLGFEVSDAYIQR